MGIFDKLIKRGNYEQSKNTDMVNQNQNSAISDQSSIEKAISERGKNIRLDQCMKVSFGDIVALGATFAQMIPSLRTISMNGVGFIPVNVSAGDVLKKAGESLVYGAHVTPDGNSIMTKWAQAGSSNAVMPFSPQTIMMVAMLANIEKKLDDIQKTQLRILSFLEQDKQAEQQGNMNVLLGILKGYKHNWDNAQYRQNHHMKVLDIKQKAETNIIFYQEQIASEIKALPAIYLDQNVKDAIIKLEKLFRNYRMALHLFAFSSFLEVMLLRNFREEYLNQVADKSREYDELFQSQILKSHELVMKFSSSSVETQVMAGLGNASKALGKLIASAPFLSQGPVDEWLQDGGDKMMKGNDEKIAKIVALFAGSEETGGEIFVDCIRNVGIISNHTTDVLFDGDTMYLAVV